ncbi:amino acid adenylation domain-containing protein [Lentzea sp. BCCO 10_0061]|uniref:Amino acid adenylation domain-containing protein n=1 Tax=Lentzea sokolovensis TaxID=3095429 RepID=A0ABU4VCK4_9PSEU|nr:amino acid adenylation domain-containing protein [Lentzea sp. BCCO 10_0061]MDX8149102.1 amino acid adenylation domain-containing protein [Lentzea sp. BCCO 10_0061]
MTDHTRRRMWFLDQLDPGNPSHHVTLITTPAAVRVPDTLLVRFDDDGRPVPGGPPVVVRSAQVPDVRAAVRAELTQPFDLREGPLVRALELNSSLLVLTMHGILGDIRVLETVLGGPTPPAVQGSPGFWLEQLHDLPVLELPTDRPRPPLHRPEAGVVPWSADVDSDALLAALQVVLGRYTRSVDVPIGVVVADELVVLRGDLSGDPTFGELCGLTAEQLTTAAAQLVGFDQLVDLLAPERDLSRHPLVQVQVDLRPRRDLYDLEAAFTSFDVEIQNGRVLYNRALFDRPRITRLLTHLAKVLQSPTDERLSRISMIDQDEAALLEKWNSTTEYLPDVSIPELFAEQVLTTPDAVAVEHGSESLTYTELDRRSNRMANLLRSRGIGTGDLVGLCLDRGADLIVTILGVLKAGAAYVPIDPEHPLDRIQFMVDDARLSVVVSRNRVLFHRPLSPSEMDSQPDSAPPRTTPDAPAYMIYTSGSTGRPKGVLMPGRCVVNLVRWQEKVLEREEESRTAQFTTATFDVSVQEIFSALLFGGTLVIPSDEVRRDPAAFAAWLDAERITRLFVPDSVLRALLDEEPSFASMRHVSQAGEPLTLDVKLRNFCALRPLLRVHNHYGPAESHVITSCSLPADVVDWPAIAPIGGPIDNTRIHLLDASLLPIGVGVAGQLCVSGAGLASGYHGRPELSERKFVTKDGELMYLTGDLASWNDAGQLEFHGRVDDQVKIRGVRVEPGEIEAVLNTHPKVTRAVVVLRDKQLIAYYTGEADDLLEHCAALLPVQLVPSVFLPVTTFPLLTNGKIDRRALPVPSPRSPHVRPRTTEEAALCQVFADVLGIEDVGATDDFFALGGHSLLATRVITRVRAELGAELPLPAVFHHRTPQRLARILSGERSWTKPVTPRAHDSVPLSIAQNQGNRWFGSVLAAGFWTVPLALRLQGPLDLGHLQSGLDRVVRGHEALRTAFVERDGVVLQEVRSAQAVPLKVVDVSSVEEAAFIAGDEMTVPFDLASGMLLRARVLRLADEDHVLLLTMHHLVSDGWSQALLIEELNGAAAAPSVQYADFTLWEQDTLSPEHAKYWQQHLDGMRPIELPTKADRDVNPLGPGELLPWSPSKELLSRVSALAGQEQATPYEVLLAAFKVLLSQLTRTTDVVVGTPMANRVRPELEQVIGLFAKVVALRTDLSGDPDFREVLRRVKETTTAAHEHQEVPFHEVVEGIPLRLTFALVPPVPELRLPGVTATAFEARQRGPVIVKSEVTFHLHDTGGHVVYNSLLFTQQQAVELLARFADVLRAVTADPSLRLSEIEIV